MITTVIPTFERSKMLKRAIESALAQDIEGQQICVHDNASSDDTEKVVEEYCKRDGRVRYFRNPVNIGAQKNIYNGIVAVETPYYSVLSDDDFLLPRFYESALDSFFKFPEAAFVCCKTVLADITNKRIEHRNRDWKQGYYLPSPKTARKMYNSHIVSTSVVFSKKIKEKLGPFDSSGSDSLYMTMASSVFPFAVVERYGAVVTMHPGSYSMIGEGVNKERIASLNSSFIDSLKLILNQDMDDDRKVSLITLYFNRLHEIFDTKRLTHHLYGIDDELLEQVFDMPSFITNRGVVNRVYISSPSIIRPFVRSFYKLIHWLNVSKSKGIVGDWKVMDNKTYERLLSFDDQVGSLDLGL